MHTHSDIISIISELSYPIKKTRLMPLSRNEMIDSWVWSIYKYLIQINDSLSIQRIRAVCPKPEGLSNRTKLLPILRSSDLIHVHETSNSSQAVVECMRTIRGITISSDHMNTYVKPLDTQTFILRAHNSSPHTHILQSIHIDQKHNCFTSVSPDSTYEGMELPPEGSLGISIAFQPCEVAVYDAIITLEFEACAVCYLIQFTCGNKALMELLKPTSSYKKKKVRSSHGRDKVDYGGVKPSSDTSTFKCKPSRYPIPRRLKLDDDINSLIVKEEVTRNDMKTYFEFQHKLLWAEESYVARNLQIYDIPDGKLKRTNGGLLRLRVQGLLEKRPSIVRGDAIHAVLDSKTYSGYVHEIQLDNVLLKFHSLFHMKHKDSNTYHIRFTLSRSTIRILHQALDLAKNCRVSWIFPRQSHISLHNANLPNPDLQFFNRDLNEEQQLAIKSALASEYRHIPYVIFGPPGTGKTVTVVELIHQFVLDRKKHVLVCATSNSAANLLCQRLSHQLNQKHMFRLMAFGRSDVPEDVERFCKYCDVSGGYVLPKLKDLCAFSVIVSTCAMAGKLYNIGIPENHFDMIVLDEAGYAWEAETMACIRGQRKGRLILAGDHKQLSPTTMNPDAGKKGLELSMMERLSSTCQLYKRRGNTGYDPRFITKLVRCYRCHPSIIAVPNELFYDNELIPSGNTAITHRMCGWQELPNTTFPIIFHATSGKNEREGSSPSWFNSSEIEVIVSYVKKLITNNVNNVNCSDIGIIAPYQKQVSKLNTALKHENIRDIAVGSCEQFQGQEKLVIIMSTVRSCHQFIETDINLNLGFVSNAKRFNVAITRAKALLIVVGNPDVLHRDNNWKRFIDSCRESNAIRGLNSGDAQS